MGSVGNLLIVGGESGDLDEFVAATTFINEEGVWSSLNRLVPIPVGMTPDGWLGTRYGTKHVELRRIDASSLEFYCESQDDVGQYVARLSEQFPRLVFCHRFMHESDQPLFSGWQVCRNGERLCGEVCDDRYSDVDAAHMPEDHREAAPSLRESAAARRLTAALGRLCQKNAMIVGLADKYRQVLATAAELRARNDVGSDAHEWDLNEACIDATWLLHDVDCRIHFHEAGKGLRD